MKDRFYTVLVTPHVAGNMRRLRLSRNFVVAMCGLGVLCLGAALVLPYLVLRDVEQRDRIDHLEREAARLGQMAHELESSLSVVRGRLQWSEEQAARLAMMVGLGEGESAEIAAGGGDPLELASGQSSPALLLDELGVMSIRSRALQQLYSRIESSYTEKLEELSRIPAIMPVEGVLGHGFGWRRDPFTGQREFHRGLDIIAPLGTPVRATADGLVTKAGTAGAFGKAVYLSHGNGLVTRFGHLSRVLAEEGQQVMRGDVIGRVGSTGRSTGAHLHYEVRVHKKPSNPMNYILED